MTAEDNLAKLVGFAPVAGSPNAPVSGWAADMLRAAGAEVTVIEGPEGDRFDVFATFGPRERAGIILSGHMDVVPARAADWASDPFTLTERDGRLYGRGSSDMLGFLACVLAVAPEFTALSPERPVHVAFSYDEELGCLGVPALIARLDSLCARPWGAVIGEPTRLEPIRGHKGKAALGVEVRGRTGHSSRPDLGLNAIHGMAEVLNSVIETAGALEHGPKAGDFAPAWSTMQAGVFSGGEAVNIIPDRAAMEIEVRAIPGVDPEGLLAPVLDRLAGLRAKGYDVSHAIRSTYPAMALAADHPLAALVERAAGKPSVAAVSFGTEAGLFERAGIPSIICGPGDIARAHKPDEYITRDELAAGTAFVRAVVSGAATL